MIKNDTRWLTSKASVATQILLLLALPLSGLCQSASDKAEESTEAIEEIVVKGSQSLVSLKLEMHKAEDELYGLFNSYFSDDIFEIRCYKEAKTGSHIKHRVCKTNFYKDLIAEETRKMLYGEPYIYPAAEIKQMNERMLAEMTEITREKQEVFDALVKVTKARQTLESERKRRCEGRFLFCRK